MTSVVFKNKGEIDPKLIATFGVSVKEEDNPIGFFGTGLKYAIAILLRNGQQVVIHSGECRLEFTLQRVEMRGKPFDVVAMNGTPLGFTTHLGAKWEMWQAYRELYCNAIDEGGSVEIGEASPVAGETLVVVTGDAFATTHANRGMFILQTLPKLVVGPVEVHEDNSTRAVFFKGIRVNAAQFLGKYSYNFLCGIDLTEDRTLKNSHWDILRLAGIIRTHVVDRAFLRDVLCAQAPYEESGFNYSDGPWSDGPPSATFLDVVGELIGDNVAQVNSSARALYKKLREREARPTAREPTVIERKQLDRAVAFCRSIGFAVDEFPISLAESLGPNIMGLADLSSRSIYVSTLAFDQGTKRLASTLIEEWAHLKHDMEDESRRFQDWLIDRLVGLGERLRGEPL